MTKMRYTTEINPVGYTWLIEKFAIEALPHYRQSYILAGAASYSEYKNEEEIHYYSNKYFLKEKENPLHHLEFALKYDGINLEILLDLFQKINERTIETYVNSQPTSKLSRKIWYLYEFLTGKTLNLKNAKGGSYTLLLDPKDYYTGKIIRSPRHYIDDNMLGNQQFSPIVRRSQKLKNFEGKNLTEIANQLIQKYDPEIIMRAVNYLYVKETMSSYEIEREKPDSLRTRRFVEALKKADHMGVITKETLVQLQNMIVDPRYADKDYRDFQNYIGTEIRLDTYDSFIHYMAPKPEDVPSLMQGLIDSLERMISSPVNPVIIAASIAFGFVFIHPFEDGNGRLHRFIMHYIFARLHFVPKGAIFPISAIMLKERIVYDTILESFSKPLLNLIKHYDLNARGELVIKEKTASYYRYLDYTRFAEYLFDCVEKTIYADLEKELNYIVNYDKTKKAIQEIIDMPDKKMNLFIQFAFQNQGKLSTKKREGYFSLLTDQEVKKIEEAIQAHLINLYDQES